MEAMRDGFSVLMDIDVQGADQVRDKAQSAPEGDAIREGFVDIFIAPPSMEELRNRLENRGEDTAEEISRRLNNAADEMSHAGKYKHVIVNDDLGKAYRRLRDVIDVEKEDRMV